MYTLDEVLAMMKKGCAFPGGYTLAAYTPEGDRLCYECLIEALDELHEMYDQGGYLVVDIYWEGPPQHCRDCDAEFESEYGDPNAEETD